MKTTLVRRSAAGFAWIILGALCAGLPAPVLSVAQQSAASAAPPAAGAAQGAETFSTPHEAAVALVSATERFDVAALVRIFGPDAEDIIFTGETPLDRQRAADFAAQANEKRSFSMDPSGTRAILLVGNGEWPLPVPLVKRNGVWSFDIQAGRQELLYRRVGANELDAIAICHGYVDAQYDYAYEQRQEFAVHQYAQRVISTPGTHDGLAWQNPDGTWGGPIGENVARAIQQGYTQGQGTQPFHGYFFKVLTGQGPAAPLGAMNFVVQGAMIGGFALAAAPAEYMVTGVKTFIVSYQGVVYQKDLGPNTLAIFQNMTLYNPDSTWQRTDDSW